MKIHGENRDRSAFSRIDLLIVLGALILAAAFLLPARTRCKGRASRISCVNNLKNIGLGSRAFSVDSHDILPWRTNSVKLPGIRRVGDALASGDLIFIYARLSNELSGPKVLICPDDRRTSVTTNSFQALLGDSAQRDTVPSYFIGLTASEERPESILSGDRNLFVGRAPEFDWRKVIASTPVWLLEGKNTKIAASIRFDVNTIHKGAGNILLGDGSVQQVSSGRLRDAVFAAHDRTNRIEWLMPVDH